MLRPRRRKQGPWEHWALAHGLPSDLFPLGKPRVGPWGSSSGSFQDSRVENGTKSISKSSWKENGIKS